MRIVFAFRLIVLLAFALSGGASPVAASSDHIVICGADGVKRFVAFDFNTGKPIEADFAEVKCQHCFGIAQILTPPSTTTPTNVVLSNYVALTATSSTPPSPIRARLARAPPSLIL